MRIRFASKDLASVIVLVAIVITSHSSASADPVFSAPVNLSISPLESSEPRVASSGSNVFVVWSDRPVSNQEILLSRSSDGGKTFPGTPINISDSPSASSAPWVAASGDDVYVIWTEFASPADTPSNGYYMRRSTDAGLTFDAPRHLTSLFGIPPFGNCAMAASGASQLLLSCQQAVAGFNDVLVAVSSDKGDTFSGLLNVSNTPITSSSVCTAGSGSNFYVAWVEGSGSASEIFLVRSSDWGVSFGSPLNMSNTPGSSSAPTLDTDGNNVWLTWSESGEVFFRYSTNAGGVFSDAVNLSNNSTSSLTPSVRGRGNDVFVAWADAPESDPASNKPEIYLRSSSDAGGSFGAAENISDSPSLNSGQPRVGLTELAASVIWLELMPGIPAYRDVFYSSIERSIPVPPPSLVSLAPASGMQAQTLDVLLSGSAFRDGARWQFGGNGIAVNSVQYLSSNEMRANVTIDATAATGPRDLTVTNSDGQTARMNGAFTVMTPSAFALIEMTRVDVGTGVGNGGFLSDSSAWRSLLAHLENAERALGQPTPNLAAAISQIDAFYIKIVNLAKGKKPDITLHLYSSLYNDYAALMSSLGGSVKTPSSF